MTTKITIVGDIMCEPLLLKAAKNGKTYNFESTFEKIKDLFEESDLGIGNLETPLAGESTGYTSSLLSFNAPDSFVDAVTNAGISLVLTANNHCLDRGIDGLVRTVKTLKKKRIPFAGTFESDLERKEATYIEVNGVKIAIISYTYGTNYSSNHIVLNEEQQKLVNLLRPQDELYYIPEKPQTIPIYKKVLRKVFRRLPEEERFYVKKFFGMTVNSAHVDDNLNKETAERFLAQMREDIARAKKNADLVFFCPHIGGQFNKEPGAFSEYVFQQAAECRCDLIAASHSHVVLKAEMIQGIPCFYSLGNFIMSPNSVYLLHENLPDYGIVTHVYVEDKTIKKITFSIVKIVEHKNQCLTVYPFDRYIQMISNTGEIKKTISEAKRIYHTVTGQATASFPIQKEYELWY